MNKEQLIALGLTEEQVKAVTEGYGIMIPKSRLDDKIAELKTATDTIAERDTQIKDLGKKAGDNDELKKQITDLTEANKKAADEYAATLAKKDYDHELSKVLGASKAKNVKALTALLDLDKVKLVDGKLTDLDEQLKALKESDAYLFEEEDVIEEDHQGDPAPRRWSAGQGQGNNDPADPFAAKLAKYK